MTPPRVLHPDKWCSLDAAVWRTHRQVLLCSDAPEPDRNRRLVVNGSYQPDTFTVAERVEGPEWLPVDERDYPRWLRGLVARRLTGVAGISRDMAPAAVTHVADQVMWLLDQDLDGATVAHTLFNQELPYVVDRVIAHCLLGDVTAPTDQANRYRRLGHTLLTELLVRRRHTLTGMDPATALRVAITAGLVGLDVKGGAPLPCPPIRIGDYATGPHRIAERVWGELAERAAPPAVDHTASFIAAVTSRPAKLVWFLDDLIESGFDLIAIQTLTAANPRLTVHIVPKRGRHDTDADYHDVVRTLRLPALAPLGATAAAGRVTISQSGPAMAAANPLKFSPDLAGHVRSADVVFAKGGRIDEMLAGQLPVPLYSAYVVVRDFTESIAGMDARGAPGVLVASSPHRRAWWGWRGRAHRTITLHDGRTIPAVHTTVAEHHRRATTTDPAVIRHDIASLLARKSTYTGRDQHVADAELRRLHDRLARLSAPTLR